MSSSESAGGAYSGSSFTKLKASPNDFVVACFEVMKGIVGVEVLVESKVCWSGGVASRVEAFTKSLFSKDRYFVVVD